MYSFYKLYIQQSIYNQRSVYTKNNQYISTLYENIILKNEIRILFQEHSEIKGTPVIEAILSPKNTGNDEDRFIAEKEKINKLLTTYNEHYSTLQEALKFLIFSAIILTLATIMLWFLMRKWVISPIQKLSSVSKLISEQNISVRIQPERRGIFLDEFHNLYKTYNQMLDSIENNIVEIKEKERFLQRLINAIPDGIRVIDKNHNIIIANEEYYKSFEKNHTTNKCYHSLFDHNAPCVHSHYKCPVKEILNKKNKANNVKLFSKNDKKYISIHAAALKASKDELYVVESLRDLSDDIKFSYNQKLSSMGFLSTSIAHEMKNNLGAIRMIIESIIARTQKGEFTGEETIKYMEMLHEQIIGSIEVPVRLLKLSSTENDETERVNCIEILKDIVALLDYEAKSRGAILQFKHFQDEVYANLLSNEFKIAIINLIQNSLAAIKNQGYVIIECFEVKNKVTIKIKDSGAGISKEDLAFIFYPFFSQGKDYKATGNGLGLPIVKSIIDKFDGKIKVYSKKNLGTTFAITFEK
ncbi:MAG: ATP-binding protein [Alphaproteobacteria bacterium]|nr:ATP-binding protein [Alphaproteobacteria bacterium]